MPPKVLPDSNEFQICVDFMLLYPRAARELGVSDSQLSKWRKDFSQHGANSFPDRGVERLTDEQREIKRLQTKLKDKELDIGKRSFQRATKEQVVKEGFESFERIYGAARISLNYLQPPHRCQRQRLLNICTDWDLRVA